MNPRVPLKKTTTMVYRGHFLILPARLPELNGGKRNNQKVSEASNILNARDQVKATSR